jgi:hypothetical protein
MDRFSSGKKDMDCCPVKNRPPKGALKAATRLCSWWHRAHGNPDFGHGKSIPDLPTNPVGCRLSSLEARSFQSWWESLRIPRRVTWFRYLVRKARREERAGCGPRRGFLAIPSLEQGTRSVESWHVGHGDSEVAGQISDQGRNSSTTDAVFDNRECPSVLNARRGGWRASRLREATWDSREMYYRPTRRRVSGQMLVKEGNLESVSGWLPALTGPYTRSPHSSVRDNPVFSTSEIRHLLQHSVHPNREPVCKPCVCLGGGIRDSGWLRSSSATQCSLSPTRAIFTTIP